MVAVGAGGFASVYKAVVLDAPQANTLSLGTSADMSKFSISFCLKKE